MANENDYNDDIISRLRGISSDEKSEIGKMKCRIDDQARLIMMLKKRNDEYILANMALDKHSIQLEKEIEELRQEIEQGELMKDKIIELNQTIEQLKTINNQWKSKEEELNKKFLFQTQTNENIQENCLSSQIKIQKLEKLLEESKENFQCFQNESDMKFHQQNIIIENHLTEIKQLKKKILNLEIKLEEKEKTLEKIEENHSNNVNQFEKNKQSLEKQIQLLEQRLQEFLNNEDILKQKLIKSEQLLNEAKKRFIIEEERVNVDVRVEKLQSKLNESQDKIEKLEQEFLAYKNYTTSLLNKEKHLNERLQLLLNGRTT